MNDIHVWIYFIKIFSYYIEFYIQPFYVNYTTMCIKYNLSIQQDISLRNMFFEILKIQYIK